MEFDNREENIVSIYKDVISGKRKQFPKGFWSPDDINSKVRFKHCIRFCVYKIHQFTRDKLILNYNSKFLKDNYLISVTLNGTFKSFYESLEYSFEELNIKIWELPKKPDGWITPENINKAVRWLFNDKLKYTQNDIENCKDLFHIFVDNRLASILSYSDNNNIKRILIAAFPEYKFNESKFKHNVGQVKLDKINKNYLEIYMECISNNYDLPRHFWSGSKDEVFNRFINCVKYLFEYKNWTSIDDIYDNFNMDTFKKYRLLSAFKNKNNMLSLSTVDLAQKCFGDKYDLDTNYFKPGNFRYKKSIKLKEDFK